MNEEIDYEENENSNFKEFGPITPDDKTQGYGSFFTQFFKRNKTKSENETSPKKTDISKPSVTQVEPSASYVSNFTPSHSSNVKVLTSDISAGQASKLSTGSGIELLSHERTLKNVLKRIKNIADKRGSTPQQYRDSDFKQYWLPDQSSKGCYDCNERFTPLRRRHHCRICGQIFCSKCCNRAVPGKIMGYKGDFRVCTFCYKVVFCCLKTNNFDEDVLAELIVFEEDLMAAKDPTKSAAEGGSLLASDASIYDRRKNMYGFMEENYTIRSRGSNFASCMDQKQMEQIASERQLLLKDSQQLQSLWSMMVSGPNKLPLTTNRYRIKSIPDSFIGKDFVQWLLNNDKASSRISAVAIGQALLEAGFIVGMSETDQFVDEHALFKIKADALDNRVPATTPLSSAQDMGQEPLWLEQMSSQKERGEENSTPQKSVSGKSESMSLMTVSASSSIYSLDLNIKENVVSLKNPPKGSDTSGNEGNDPESSVSTVLNDTIRSLSTVMTEEVLEALKAHEPKLAESMAAGWQENSAQGGALDEQTKIGLATKSGFNNIWRRYENRLLRHLLSTNGLDVSWCRTMVPFIYKVVETVHPDVKNENDDMDIRQYVQFKKVPGGDVSECRIVNGTVCTKNITHRQMRSQITDPQILIIASHIDYHRSSARSKEDSIENILRHEETYVQNVVSKIMTYRPDIVITKEGVSNMAKEYLLARKITVVMNVKSSVIDRIARCTQANVFLSVEDMEASIASTDNPHYPTGMCHSFYINSFNTATSPLPKHLMYFDGCATHLGCTIILRGASNDELKIVKRIMYFMIFALYSWKLERSYMMDIFASVPPQRSICYVTEEGEKMETETEDNPNAFDFKKQEKLDTESVCNSPSELSPASSRTFPLHSTPSKVTEANLVSDNSDPLRSYLGSSPSDKSENVESDSSLTSANTNFIPFCSAIDNSVISVSPFIKFKIPFLESKKGKVSPLRKFFDDQLYFSSNFNPQQPKKIVFQDIIPKKNENKNVEFRPSHYLVTSKLTKGAKDMEVRTALSDYRARGGTIRNICSYESQECRKEKKVWTDEEIKKLVAASDRVEDIRKKEMFKKFEYTPEGKIDALHPYNHQRISILFSNFSQSFHYTSSFCVNPSVLTMAFYGRNDISLGSFLERYCFNPNYKCLSVSCQAPIVDHVRKFVHENGCIEILLRKMDSSLDEVNSSTIYMWTWCKKCRQVSPVVPMSSDTWALSFAKYLELRFHDSNINRRGSPGCSHSIHREHFHYFGQRDMVAILKYITIPTRELVMPPSEIRQTLNTLPHSYFVDNVKAVAIQGYGIFSSIVDRLSTISEEIGQRWDPLLESVASHHQQQKQLFRESIENVQLQLTSPALENHWTNFSSPKVTKDVSALVFRISDQLVRIKGIVAKVVQDWNSKIEDLMRLRKKEEKEKFRTNSGNLTKQSGGSTMSSVPSALAGSAEQLHITTKDDSLFQQSDVSSEVVGGEKTETPRANRKATAAASSSDEVTSEKNVDKRESGMEKESKISDHQSMQSFAQRLEDEKISIVKALDDLNNVPTSPISTVRLSLSPAEVASSLSTAGSAAYFANTATEKDIGGGIHAVLSSQVVEDTRRKRNISVSSTSFRVGLEQFIPSKCCHERSLSDDGEVTIAKEAVEKIPEKRYSSSVKNIIAKVWTSSEDLKIKSPFEPTEYFNILPEVRIPVVIYDNEPSSIIARSLASQEYETKLQALQKKLAECPQGVDSKLNEAVNSASSASTNLTQDGSSNSVKLNEGLFPQKDLHIDLQFSDHISVYYCKMLFVEQFRQLRQLIYPLGEDYFIRSLSRCVYWDARGGKSGSSFCKTSDDRFVLKEMSKIELDSFLDFAPSYIQYMMNCKKYDIPTALARIVGVFRIGYKNSITNKCAKLDFLVMENLFYQRCIGPKFDLKGSERNRKVTLTGKEESEVVLMDENLMQMACSNPFYLRPHGKKVLKRAVEEDTTFLAQHLVMDYSLLVGVDEDNNELIVGIIDYIRTFTWDKRIEMIIKGGVLGTGKPPTVLSPEMYRNRFCLAMESYFVLAPDRWSGLEFDTETGS